MLKSEEKALLSHTMSSASDRSPLKIHVAKAKDLPFSWYELVLRPDKFAEHLEVLLKNPEGRYDPAN